MAEAAAASPGLDFRKRRPEDRSEIHRREIRLVRFGWVASLTTALVVALVVSALARASDARAKPRPTVTVVVVGPGTVRSSPRGIACPHRCRVGFSSGARIALTPHETAASAFDHWAGACSGDGRCVVRVTRARTVVAVFDRLAAPGPSTTSPPPPPPTTTTSPPAATPGHYAGTTNHGNHVSFDVSADGQTITNVSFDAVDEGCTYDYYVDAPLQLTGGISIDSDGTFSSSFTWSGTLSGKPATDTGTFQGRFSGGGVAGTITRSDDLYNESGGTHVECSGNETWTAFASP